MAAPPSFLQSIPPETDATDGDIVTFQVKVEDEDEGPTSVSWWRCGESLRPLAGRREIVDHGDGWHELVLSNITAEDEGEYECRAENSRGHSSCFGSLYYYGGSGALVEVATGGDGQGGGDGRQSGLLILLDDGSQTEESGSEKTNRKSMTVSEQMQGILEDLTQEGSGQSCTTLGREDEDQFNSDLEELNDDDLMQNIFGVDSQKTASEDTLVPSPDLTAEAAVSEGAKDAKAPAPPPHKWSSNPNQLQRRKQKHQEVVWAADVATDTTSVELPPTEPKSTTGGAETPYDVADIVEEEAPQESGRMWAGEGATSESTAAPLPSSDPCLPSQSGDSSLTSVTADGSGPAGEVVLLEQQQGMTSSSKRTQDGRVTSTTSSTMTSMSVHRRQTRELEEDEDTVSRSVTKKTRISSAYTESEGQHTDRGVEVYVAIMDFRPMESDEEAVAMREGQRVEVIDASKPRRWFVRVLPMSPDECPREGWVPACYLEKSTAYDTLGSYVVAEAELDPKEMEAVHNREAIVKELVETEEDFAKDMQFVVDSYYKQMDRDPLLPKECRDRKGSVFGNFKDISDFHNNVLMEGIHYHAKQPTHLGKTFLRLERDFDMHSHYCWTEARAQQLLAEGGPLKEYFDNVSRRIEDEKTLSDHLKLPIQRLNDYQLLLRELIKYSCRLKEDTSDLQKALDFIHGINKCSRDLQRLQAIRGCDDPLRLGEIVRHDPLEVSGEGERYVFLFKGRLIVTEKEQGAKEEVYQVRHLLKLQDVEVREDADPLALSLHSPLKKGPLLVLRAQSSEQKDNWYRDILAASKQAVEESVEVAELKHRAEGLEEPGPKKPKVETTAPPPPPTGEHTRQEPPQKEKEETPPKPPEKKRVHQEKEQDRGRGEIRKLVPSEVCSDTPLDPDIEPSETPSQTPPPILPVSSVVRFLLIVASALGGLYVATQVLGARLWD